MQYFQLNYEVKFYKYYKTDKLWLCLCQEKEKQKLKEDGPAHLGLTFKL